MKIISAIVDKLIKWAEKYEKYVERENSILRAQVKEAQYQNIVEATQEEYNSLAKFLFDAIYNTESVTCLCLPKTVRDIRCKPSVTAFHDGYWAFRFRCYRYPRESVTADDVRRILQHELDQLCSDAGHPRIVVRVRFDADNVVAVFMMRGMLFQQRRMEHIRKTVMEDGHKDSQ